jgi:hypothetical protein
MVSHIRGYHDTIGDLSSRNYSSTNVITQVMGVLYPSAQRHYRRLILLLILLYCYMFRSHDHLQAENILLARITQLTTTYVRGGFNFKRSTFHHKLQNMPRMVQNNLLHYMPKYFKIISTLCDSMPSNHLGLKLRDGAAALLAVIPLN